MHLLAYRFANPKRLFQAHAQRACTLFLSAALMAAVGCGEVASDPEAGMAPRDAPAAQQVAPATASDSCEATPGNPCRLPEATNWPPPECDEVYDLRVHGSGGLDSPYMVPAGPESHPQFTVNPLPWGSTRVQAIAFKPIADNAKILHHVNLYNGLAMLTGWAPGDNDPQPFPQDVGIDMPTAANSLRLDVHYYNKTGTRSEPDRSGFSVCIVKGEHLRPNSAAVTQGLTSFGPILAPANNRNYASTGTCTVRATKPVTIIEASPSANKYATHMRFVVRKANGQEIVMHDQPFKFGEQRTYPLNPPVIVQSGDVITTTCTYDNPTAKIITFGESSENEQCFNFAVYYPKGALQCGL